MKKLFLIVFAVFLSISATQAINPFGKKTGIREIVLVKFKKGIPPAQKEELDKLIKNLKSDARTIDKVEWGKRLDFTGATKEYDYCLMLEFKNDNNLEIFNTNPVRMKLMGKLIPMTDKILKFTYRIE
jgi:hypothetical protein